VTAASTAGQLHLFTLDQDGRVLQKSYAPGRGADREWRSLGGRFVSPIAAAVAHQRVELFALDENHRVMHRALNSGDWKVIGENIAGSLNVLTSSKGELVVLAVGDSGEILFRSPATLEWASLGAAPARELSAAFVDDLVVLAYLEEDATVLAAAWRTYPRADSHLQWQILGTVGSLANSRFSLLPRHAAENGRKT